MRCAICGEPVYAHWVRKGCRPLCGNHMATCSACGRARDTRHPNKTEMCRSCYNQALKALQALLNNPGTRGELLAALRHADRILTQAHEYDERMRHGAHGPTIPQAQSHITAREQLADLAIALGGPQGLRSVS